MRGLAAGDRFRVAWQSSRVKWGAASGANVFIWLLRPTYSSRSSGWWVDKNAKQALFLMEGSAPGKLLRLRWHWPRVRPTAAVSLAGATRFTFDCKEGCLTPGLGFLVLGCPSCFAVAVTVAAERLHWLSG